MLAEDRAHGPQEVSAWDNTKANMFDGIERALQSKTAAPVYQIYDPNALRGRRVWLARVRARRRQEDLKSREGRIH
ncbi:MAG TPA: hypothetical protein VJ798_04005 [Rhizomicrobium sp.]|nr:hypothetical protein [Rhizomicrobium sp.]